MEIVIKTGGQIVSEIDNCIDAYEDIKKQYNNNHTFIYISFGDNLVSASMVRKMLVEGFTATWKGEELIFCKGE